MSRKFISAMSAVALLLVAPMASFGQATPAAASAPDADYAHKLELAKRYVAATHMDETMGNAMKVMSTQMVAQLEAEYPDMPKGYAKSISDAAFESTSAMMSRLMEQMTPAIAKIYSEEELVGITQFMESSIGQSMIAKSPLLSVEVAKLMPGAMQAFEADFRDRVCRKIDCNAPAMKDFKSRTS